MTTPYITPAMIQSAPLGISWSTIPTQSSTADAKAAEVANICWRASGMVDEECNQPLRCTLDQEIVYGPDYRMTIPPGSGNVHVRLLRWPVVKVTAVDYVMAAQWPRQWNSIPLDHVDIDGSVQHLSGSTVPGSSGVGPTAIWIAPGYVTNVNGRNGYAVRATYSNGWPHAGTTAAATAGQTALQIDDCTGFDSGTVVAQIFDGENTELITATASSVASGVGTITIPAGLAFDHPAGIIVSSLPQNVIWAAMLFGGAQALDRGTTAITVPTLTGGISPGGGGADDLRKTARELLHPYKRVM